MPALPSCIIDTLIKISYNALHVDFLFPSPKGVNMTVTLISPPDEDLLPVICTCQGHKCKQGHQVTEISDFTVKTLYGADRESPTGSEEIVITCQICGDYAFPPEKKRQALIKAYKVWQKTGQASKSTQWSLSFTCPECNRTSEITRRNLTPGTTADSANYGGDHPSYEVKIVCPVCESRIKARGKIPSGIEMRVIADFHNATAD